MKKRERIAQLERELDAWRREAQAGGRAIKRLERDLAASRETSVRGADVCDRLRAERDSARAERDDAWSEIDRLRAKRVVPSPTVPLPFVPWPGPGVTYDSSTVVGAEKRVRDMAGFCQQCGMMHVSPAVHLDGSPVAVRPVP